MDDLISRQAAIEIINRYNKSHMVINGKPMLGAAPIIIELEDLPSAQRTGRWIVVSDGYGNGEATACICECSECKDTIWVYKKSDRKWKYCPNCGARMEGVEDGSD